jgi:hypothetical protein
MEWNQLLNPPKGVGRISLLAGLAAGEGCSLYAIFVAHVMSPVSYRMVEHNLELRTIYGRYQELYHLDGLLFTLMASCLVFAIAWAVVRGIAWTLAAPSVVADPIVSNLSNAAGEGALKNATRSAFMSEQTRSSHLASLARSIDRQTILQNIKRDQ